MKLYRKLKIRTHEIIERAKTGDRASLVFDYLIVTLILLNILAIILRSMATIYFTFEYWFQIFEIFSVMIFTVEYILRVWTANLEYPNKDKLASIVKFIISPMALIDLFAILPFYLPMLMPFNLRFFRILRIIRFLRIFKLHRYSSALNLVGKVLREKRNELLVTVFITFMALLVASTLIYYIEHEVQPNAFPNIIVSFWWGISTLTTVGYGDVYPITGWGRFLSGIIAFLGVGLVALPTGIISSGFMQELQDKEEKKDIIYCPYCGEKIKDEE